MTSTPLSHHPSTKNHPSHKNLAYTQASPPSFTTALNKLSTNTALPCIYPYSRVSIKYSKYLLTQLHPIPSHLPSPISHLIPSNSPPPAPRLLYCTYPSSHLPPTHCCHLPPSRHLPPPHPATSLNHARTHPSGTTAYPSITHHARTHLPSAPTHHPRPHGYTTAATKNNPTPPTLSLIHI